MAPAALAVDNAPVCSILTIPAAGNVGRSGHAIHRWSPDPLRTIAPRSAPRAAFELSWLPDRRRIGSRMVGVAYREALAPAHPLIRSGASPFSSRMVRQGPRVTAQFARPAK